MKKISLLILTLVLITVLVSAYGSETAISGENPETTGLIVDITDLTEEPMFIDTEADGIAMQLIAVRAGDEVRLAFNTCQAYKQVIYSRNSVPKHSYASLIKAA